MTDFIPPYMDLTVLAKHLCLGEKTVEMWVQLGRLPPPRVHHGKNSKRLWKWKEVERYLDGDSTLVPSSDPDRIREATRRAVAEASTKA